MWNKTDIACWLVSSRAGTYFTFGLTQASSFSLPPVFILSYADWLLRFIFKSTLFLFTASMFGNLRSFRFCGTCWKLQKLLMDKQLWIVLMIHMILMIQEDLEWSLKSAGVSLFCWLLYEVVIKEAMTEVIWVVQWYFTLKITILQVLSFSNTCSVCLSSTWTLELSLTHSCPSQMSAHSFLNTQFNHLIYHWCWQVGS